MPSVTDQLPIMYGILLWHLIVTEVCVADVNILLLVN